MGISTSYDREFNKLALLDEEFLVALQEQKEREIYARVTALDINELPLEYIEGSVQSGNINIDGDSTIRRTCSLTMSTEEINISDVYWGLHTKISLEIGLRNKVKDGYNVNSVQYPEIIWFPQGIYILTSFNTSIQLKGYTISLQGKDKMCLLNGDIGGDLFAAIDFGQEEEEIKKFVSTTVAEANSEILVAQDYYIQADPDTCPNEIYITNPSTNMQYSFEKGDPSAEFGIDKGSYYRLDSFYHKIPNYESVQYFNQQRYKIYKKVMKPSEMFEQVTLLSGDYEPGKYYYNPQENYIVTSENHGSYFTVDNRSGFHSGTTYYSLKTIYKLEYTTIKKKVPLEKIIRKVVNTYAKEPFHNIIINDLDDYALEQLTFKGDTPILAIRRASDNEFYNLGFKDKVHYYYNLNGVLYELNNTEYDTEEFKPSSLDWLIEHISETHIKLDQLANLIPDYPTPFYNNKKIQSDKDISYYFNTVTQQFNLPEGKNIDDYKCYLAELSYGDDIGYRITDLTYTGDLITSLGDTITSVLDKIKDMLGEFEYFYDLKGRFVFQQKRNYVNINWDQMIDNDDEVYATYGTDMSKFSYNFEGNRLITAIQNSPQLNNVRNDFSVWGKRKNLSGSEYPIHLRFAIDKKPKEYKAFNGILYYTKEALKNPSLNYEDLINETQSSANHYVKDNSIIPTYLKDQNGESDWWELMDWAEYYKTQTGVYPSYILMKYCEEGFTGNIAFPNKTERLNNRIVIDTDISNEYKPYSGTMIWPDNYKQLNWNPFQHGYKGCGHTYAQYIAFYNLNPNLRTFIYKPRLPDESVIAIDGGTPYYTPGSDQKPGIEVDWRELIYRMALDYFAGQGADQTPIYDKDHNLVMDDPDQFLGKVAERNPDYYPTGYTGYEQYYSDMEGFWRQLYNPDYVPQEVYSAGYYSTEKKQPQGSQYFKTYRYWNDSKIEKFNVEYYVCPSENTIVNNQFQSYFGDGAPYQNNTDLRNDYEKYMVGSKYLNPNSDEVNPEFKLRYWNTKVIESPELLNFWIDFLDEGELQNFSVPVIGDRSKTLNEDKIKAIAYKLIPGLIVVSRDSIPDKEQSARDQGVWEQYEGAIIDQIRSQSGYNFVWLPKGMSKYFSISYRGLTAKDKMEALLYEYGYCAETITITALPIYHLEPNTRIYVRDDTTQINGEYIVSKINLPLDHKGTMSITAVKAPSRII